MMNDDVQITEKVDPDLVTIALGDWVETARHGEGIVRGLSHTTPELTSVDVELMDAGQCIGWTCVPLSEITNITHTPVTDA